MTGEWIRDADGSPVFVVEELDERPGAAALVSGMVEMQRRCAATPALAKTAAMVEELSAELAGALATDPTLRDVDPEVVCAVALSVLSNAGGLLVQGAPPSMFMNITSLALAMHGGHFPRPGASS